MCPGRLLPHVQSRAPGRRPRRADSLAVLLRDVHGRYATYLNARQAASGHVWQGRYFSCPLDATHLWAALRYVERHPVRAAMVAHPDAYPWSRAASALRRHFGYPGSAGSAPVEGRMDGRFLAQLLDDAANSEADPIRRYTHTGRPLGSEDFVKRMERQLCRTLVPQKGGRPRKLADTAQESPDFALTE